MASSTPVNVLEVCRLTPSIEGPESSAQLSLPLTFFDTMWFKFHPVERIFFYNLTQLTPTHFNSVILPNLKHSLSLTLHHFLPLAGNLKWPPHEPKPIIVYTPNDGVSLLIAESNADLNHLSSNSTREAIESRSYIPYLHVSESTASVISFQITLFPNQGFCIGISAHHAILDGKSTTMFIKAWAHICKNFENKKISTFSLPTDLAPFFDRSVIQVPDGLEMIYLDNWLSMKLPGSDSNPRSLNLMSDTAPDSNNLVRATFEFSRSDINNLREKVLSELNKAAVSIHLSAFVLTYAYTLVCLVKAKGLESNTKVLFGFTVDCRARLQPPVPSNYFGNCVTGRMILVNAETLIGKNGVAVFAEKVSEAIQSLDRDVLEGSKDVLAKYVEIMAQGSVETFGIAGSTRFQVYGSDFGWGKPIKVEITSIDRAGTTSVSMAESRDGSGGVEIGVALKKHEMEKFQSLFANGLDSLTRPIN